MVARGLEPDHAAVCALLDECIAGGDMATADELLEAACDWSNKSTVCAAMVKAHVRAKCLEKAMRFHESMKQYGCASPDIVMYSVLMKALVEEDRLDTAMCILEDMLAAGHK